MEQSVIGVFFCSYWPCRLLSDLIQVQLSFVFFAAELVRFANLLEQISQVLVAWRAQVEGENVPWSDDVLWEDRVTSSIVWWWCSFHEILASEQTINAALIFICLRTFDGTVVVVPCRCAILFRETRSVCAYNYRHCPPPRHPHKICCSRFSKLKIYQLVSAGKFYMVHIMTGNVVTSCFRSAKNWKSRELFSDSLKPRFPDNYRASFECAGSFRRRDLNTSFFLAQAWQGHHHIGDQAARRPHMMCSICGRRTWGSGWAQSVARPCQYRCLCKFDDSRSNGFWDISRSWFRVEQMNRTKPISMARNAWAWKAFRLIKSSRICMCTKNTDLLREMIVNLLNDIVITDHHVYKINNQQKHR